MIQTKVSINSFTDKAGIRRTVTDENFNKAMVLDAFTEELIRSIYLEEFEKSITNDPLHLIG